MKKLILIAVLAAGAVCLTGCDPVEDSREAGEAWSYHGNGCMTKIVTIENHKYILLRGPYIGTIRHAEFCGCMNRGM